MHNQELYDELKELIHKILLCPCKFDGDDIQDCKNCAFNNRADVCIAVSLYDFSEMMGMRVDE